MDDLAITVGNLGSEQYLERCLRTIYAEDAPGFTYSVLIAFNGFDAGSVMQHIAEAFPQAQVLYRRNKLGYTGTYNLLMRASAARYILLLDEDTVVPKGTLPAMVAFMDAHPEVGIAGARTLNPDGTLQKSYGVMFDLRSEFLNALYLSTFWPDRLYRNHTRWRTVDWLNGAFMLVRQKTVAEVGMLDNYFYTFSCEADWCLRIARAGWKVAFVPDVTITHVGGDHSINTAVKSYDSLVRSHINRYFFFRKHYGALEQGLLRPIMTLGACLRLLKFLGLYCLAPSRRPEAGPKIRAFARIALLGFARQPWRLTPELRRQNELAGDAI
jgi:GT2 family glycosyltransferase